MPGSQSFNSHTRYDPAFHLSVLPLLLLNLCLCLYVTVHTWAVSNSLNRLIHVWLIVMAIILFVIAGRARSMSLQVQDRVIRLEERLRLGTLLPETDRVRMDELSMRQLVALRFAPDAEIPNLVHKALTQKLDAKAIKQNIINWRPDHDRV
jgi:hypothetical protein